MSSHSFHFFPPLSQEYIENWVWQGHYIRLNTGTKFNEIEREDAKVPTARRFKS